ncbi:MAG: hypothetical protein ABIK92_18660 [Pseudomonadota bacterium]
MIRKETALLSLFIASFVTIIHIGWRKFGGLISGGRYSDSHSWNELINYIPEFLFFFGITFIGIFIWESRKKNKTYFKCPECGNVIASHENNRRICQVCGASYEYLEGYFNRHPENK